MKTRLLPFIAMIVGASTSFADSYLPASGDLNLGVSFSHTSFDQFYAGDQKQPGVPGGGEIERTSYRLYLNYGINEGVAADLSFAYADTSSSLSQGGDLTDTHLGISWQTMDTSDGDSLDLMFRVGLSLDGSYETGFLSSPGDGENGLNFKTKFGKAVSDNGTRIDGEIGYATFSSPVPDSFYLRAGPTFPLGNGIKLDLSGIHFSASGGIDIGGAGFTGLQDLPQVEEKGTAGEIGLSFGAGNAYYRISVSQLFDGENIGEELTYGVFSSFKF